MYMYLSERVLGRLGRYRKLLNGNLKVKKKKRLSAQIYTIQLYFY